MKKKPASPKRLLISAESDCYYIYFDKRKERVARTEIINTGYGNKMHIALDYNKNGKLIGIEVAI